MVGAITALKKSMAPVFHLALTASNKELARSKLLNRSTAAGLVCTGGAGSWIYLYGATTMTLGVFSATGIGTTALGGAAYHKFRKWNQNQDTNRM